MKNCPLCGKRYVEYPATSRVLDIEICPNCGIKEALRPQTEKSFIELWSTAKRLPDGSLEQIREHFSTKKTCKDCGRDSNGKERCDRCDIGSRYL